MERLVQYVKDVRLVESIILFMSVVSVNFAAYISYFDINVLSIIDSTALTKHVFGLLVVYIIVSASVTLFLFFLSSGVFYNFAVDLSNVIPNELIKSLRFSPERSQEIIESPVTKYFFVFLIFLFSYVGVNNALLVILVFFVYFSLIALHRASSLYRKNDPKEWEATAMIKADEKFKNKSESIKGVYLFGQGLSIAFKKDVAAIALAIKSVREGEFLGFMASKIGIALIFTSLVLGIGRADYVSRNVIVTLEEGNGSSVLFMSTFNGVGLYNSDDGKVEFVSWDNINSLSFSIDNKKTLTNLID